MKKAAYILYFLAIVLFLTYCLYSEFYSKKLDNLVEVKITVSSVSRTTKKGLVGYTVVDESGKTYFFTSNNRSNILDRLEGYGKLTDVEIKFNTRNNEILYISNGIETNESSNINWTFIIALSSIAIIFVLYSFLKKAILEEWFFRSKTNNS